MVRDLQDEGGRRCSGVLGSWKRAASGSQGSRTSLLPRGLLPTPLHLKMLRGGFLRLPAPEPPSLQGLGVLWEPHRSQSGLCSGRAAQLGWDLGPVAPLKLVFGCRVLALTW